MIKHLAWLSAVVLMGICVACSSSEDEPILLEEETQLPDVISADVPDSENYGTTDEENNLGNNEISEESFLSKEEFQEQVVGKYWYLKVSDFYYANGDVCYERPQVVGNYGLLALYVAPEGYIREYQAFSYKYFQHEPYEYDETTGILTAPNIGYGSYKIHKVESGELYISYRYDKTILDEEKYEYVPGSYTYSVFAPATDEQLHQLSLYGER